MVDTKSKRIYKNILEGKVWTFPDNVDTDVISPGRYLDDHKATLEHTCESVVKKFPAKVENGDIIVAGRNFGCGSSRESAPAILQAKGISAIIAKSFGRIFYRSSFARALPLFEIEYNLNEFRTGDTLKINISTAEITNLRSGKKLHAKKIHPILMNFLKNGGMINLLLKECQEKAKKIE